jgi:hypothetical protein
MTLISEFEFNLTAEVFFKTLFEECPDVRAKFSNINIQKMMFVTVLQTIDNMLEEKGAESIIQYMNGLGQKHKELGLSNLHMSAGRAAFEQAIQIGGRDIPHARQMELMGTYDVLVGAMGFERKT